MVYDVLPIQIPDNFFPLAVEHYVHQLRMMAKCDTLLTDSLHLPPVVKGALEMMECKEVPRILPVPLHISKEWLTDNPPETPKSLHFAQIGAIETRKNHHVALSGFARLTSGNASYSIIGRQREVPEFMQHIIDVIHATGKHVHMRHGLSDADIRGLSRSVTAFICPSTAEGYGLPVLEALAMGVPVVASDIAPHRQFASVGGIVFFDPSDVLSIERAMKRVANPEENSKLRTSIQFNKIPADPAHWARSVRIAIETSER
jgi:glycogen synthase